MAIQHAIPISEHKLQEQEQRIRRTKVVSDRPKGLEQDDGSWRTDAGGQDKDIRIMRTVAGGRNLEEKVKGSGKKLNLRIVGGVGDRRKGGKIGQWDDNIGGLKDRQREGQEDRTV